MVPNTHLSFVHIITCIMADVKLLIIHIQLIIMIFLKWDIVHLLIAAPVAKWHTKVDWEQDYTS